jgi:hypothetical protein
MDFLHLKKNGVFELPLPRNAKKRINFFKEFCFRMAAGWVWDLADVRGGPSIVFAGPSPRSLVASSNGTGG